MKIVNGLAITLIFIGAVGFFAVVICHVVSYTGIRMLSTKIRFPLGQTGGFAVSNEGHIIHYSGYNRLEIFSNEGCFLRGWFVYTPFSNAEIRVDPNNLIHLVSQQNRHLVFDIKGNIIMDSVEEGIYDHFSKLNRNRVHRDSKGNIYKLSGSFPRIGVIKVTSSGTEFIDITEPFYFWPFGGGLTSLLFLIPGILIWNVVSWAGK